MKAVLSACLLFGLLSPVALLQCYFCPGGLCDTPEIVNCTDDQDACVSAINKFRIGEIYPGSNIHSKYCGKTREDCVNKRFSMHVGEDASYRSHLECCCRDNCNKEFLTLSDPVKLPPNGIQCPSCIAFGETECSETENIACTGEETKCIVGAMVVETDTEQQPSDIAFQGCGTPSICTAKISKAPVSSNEMKYTVKRIQCINNTEVITV
ncbi:phospholipase A2 inhibitor gamma subunit B-like [Eublepharis macularius]|uniref:Phospholipase A2 inhibitor gamma subunit B-like n=1 Tax=Eublepharis macularius TaxID=481883 RepID=A0AA97KAT5_EUBMA|nr:phospholipase A2 inhibitor gamma subunit B-like [Eublepharis macularius]